MGGRWANRPTDGFTLPKGTDRKRDTYALRALRQLVEPPSLPPSLPLLPTLLLSVKAAVNTQLFLAAAVVMVMLTVVLLHENSHMMYKKALKTKTLIGGRRGQERRNKQRARRKTCLDKNEKHRSPPTRVTDEVVRATMELPTSVRATRANGFLRACRRRYNNNSNNNNENNSTSTNTSNNKTGVP